MNPPGNKGPKVQKDEYPYTTKPGELQPVKSAFPNFYLDSDDVEAAAMHYGDGHAAGENCRGSQDLVPDLKQCERLGYGD